MQSSAAVTGRALLMLACVVALPALALSGTSWSEMLKRLQEFHWSAVLSPAVASSSASLDHPPQLAASSSFGQLAATAPSPVAAGRNRGPAELAGTAPAAASAASDAATAPSPADPFRPIEDRLRQLGATYYVLETWGKDQQVYRFYCKMAVGGHADYNRCFEVTDSDPVQAMLHALRQVEAWKEGGGRRAEGEATSPRGSSTAAPTDGAPFSTLYSPVPSPPSALRLPPSVSTCLAKAGPPA